MQRVLVLDVVGLTRRQIGSHTPHLAALAQRGSCAPMAAVFPAVTLSAQATFLTGLPPSGHGAVGNGWYFRELGEAWLWRQPNALIQGEKIYETARARHADFTCAKLFWWWNMGAAVDWSVTPKPFYPADGRKILAAYGTPNGYLERLETELGKFPFFDFWGPRAGLGSSRWIAQATMRTLEEHAPTLTLAYLPHLDYDQQRFGPKSSEGLRALGEVDDLVGQLVASADASGIETIVVSEYGIEEAKQHVDVNRILRRAGLLAVRDSPVGETLDTFASRAFAVADHQAAHVYTRDAAALEAAREALEGTPGIALLLDRAGQRQLGIDHPRSGELVLAAAPHTWFTYYYWLDEERAPDFAPTVDIHRKPGYDPCELFIDPKLRIPALRVGRRLLQKALGMRYLMDVVPLQPELVRGTHGRLPDHADDGPVFLCSRGFEDCGGAPAEERVSPTSVPERILALLERG